MRSGRAGDDHRRRHFCRPPQCHHANLSHRRPPDANAPRSHLRRRDPSDAPVPGRNYAPLMELAGKTAVVTGASSGIGAATVRQLRAAGVRVAGGARRVERVDADVALELDVTDEAASAGVRRRGGRGARRASTSSFNNAGPRPRPRLRSTSRAQEDEETVIHTNVDGVLRMTRLCLPHIRDGGHIVYMGSIAGRQAYANGAVVHRVEVRGAGLLLRVARGPARPPDPHHDGRRRARGDGVLASSASSGDEEKATRSTTGVDPLDAGGHRRLRALRAHAAAARERRRDRDQGARAVERRPHRPRTRSRAGADDPRGLDVLHLRRARRLDGETQRPLRARHALPLAAPADDQRRAAAPALVGQGRVLLGRVLPPQPARRRA